MKVAFACTAENKVGILVLEIDRFLRIGNEQDKAVIETLDTEYLCGNITDTNRCNAFCKFVSRITKNILGIKLTTTCFRKIAERDMAVELGIDEAWIATYKRASELALQRGHNLATVIQYYL